MRLLATVSFLVFIIGALLIPDAASTHGSYPGSDAPIWLWSDCSLPSVTVGWYNPPEEVLPFTAYFPAYLTILGDGWGETEIMTYIDGSTCPNYPGCIFYRWRKVYEHPPGDYTLTAYVINAADDIFYVQPETFAPGCFDKYSSYLPVLLK